MRQLTCVFEHASVDDSKINIGHTKLHFINVLLRPECPFFLILQMSKKRTFGTPLCRICFLATLVAASFGRSTLRLWKRIVSTRALHIFAATWSSLLFFWRQVVSYIATQSDVPHCERPRVKLIAFMPGYSSRLYDNCGSSKWRRVFT